MKKYFKNYIQSVTNPLPEMADFFDTENHYLRSLLSRKCTALDVGCGNGRSMKFLAPYCQRIVGIDRDRRMIFSAKKNLDGVRDVDLVLANFLTKRFKARFDIVYAAGNLIGTPEMLIDRGQSIVERMVRTTKPGGHTIVSAWSDNSLNFARRFYPTVGIKVLKIAGNDVITDYGIFRRFTRRDLHTIAKGLGRRHKVLTLTPLFYLLDIEV